MVKIDELPCLVYLIQGDTLSDHFWKRKKGGEPANVTCGPVDLQIHLPNIG